MDAGINKPGMAATDFAAIAPEDSGRAGFYAIIGRLFHAAPEADLIAQIADSGNAGKDDGADQAGGLALAWRDLQAACEKSRPDALQQEHAALFIGVGKAQVTPYTSGYVAHIAPDRHLVLLRQQLAAWGLARHDMVFDSEDHISGLCDVMRFLIEKNQSLEIQKQFFEEFVQTGAMPFCDAVIAAGNAAFYRQVGVFSKAFFEVEKAAFDMLTPG
ncbi:MAG: molecular chaperone TorD family protein [Pseudomonadota bacterium]